jgi:ClpP class serine protease
MRTVAYACEQNYILEYLDHVENASEENTARAASMFDDEDSDPVDDIYEEDGEEARISIEGLLTQSGPPPIARFFGASGTAYRDIREACNRAAASSCKSVTFEINSPGGEVAGCDQTWQAMRALMAVKPCRAVNTGLMASAAIWLGTAVGRGNLFADSPACEQGSIGVKQVVIDDSGLRDAIGVKKITIVSKNAPRKGEDGAKKADRDEMQERCDQMESIFIDRVATGRGCTPEKVIADFGRGGVLTSLEAKAAGLIDDIIPPRGIVSPVVPDSNSRRFPGMSGLAAVHESTATPAPVAPAKEKPMTLKELLATDATALAEYNAAMKAQFDAGKAEMQAVAKKVGAYLTSDVYSKSKAIVERALKAMSGEGTAEAVEAMVSMFDLMAEDKKQAAAAEETKEQGETAPLKIEEDAVLLAKAAELKIDIKAIEAAALAAKMDPVAALKAEIANREMVAADRARTGA